MREVNSSLTILYYEVNSLSRADEIYNELILDIYNNGQWDKDGDVRTKYEDGSPAYTKSVFGRQVKFAEGEIPIITTKFVANKTAYKENWIFYVLQSHLAETFEKYNVSIWREWYKEIDGKYGIGRSYAYQLKKYKQMEKLIYNLKHHPYSRRHLISFFNKEDEPYKALQECAWAVQFNVRNNKLDMLLIQRSVDSALGLPFNWSGYYSILTMLAQTTGYEVGEFTHQMGNVHYYDRHEELLLKQIEGIQHEQPIITINPEVKDFFQFTENDYKIDNYNHNGKFEYEVAI